MAVMKYVKVSIVGGVGRNNLQDSLASVFQKFVNKNI